MSIERYYNDALENMERTVHGLASCVPQEGVQNFV